MGGGDPSGWGSPLRVVPTFHHRHHHHPASLTPIPIPIHPHTFNAQPKGRDLSRFVKWPRYIRIQRQRKVCMSVLPWLRACLWLDGVLG